VKKKKKSGTKRKQKLSEPVRTKNWGNILPLGLLSGKRATFGIKEGFRGSSSLDDTKEGRIGSDESKASAFSSELGTSVPVSFREKDSKGKKDEGIRHAQTSRSERRQSKYDGRKRGRVTGKKQTMGGGKEKFDQRGNCR